MQGAAVGQAGDVISDNTMNPFVVQPRAVLFRQLIGLLDIADKQCLDKMLGPRLHPYHPKMPIHILKQKILEFAVEPLLLRTVRHNSPGMTLDIAPGLRL